METAKPIVDPIVEKWKSNYIQNQKIGLFSNPKSKAIKFLLNNDFYHNVPFVLIVAGPSLDKNIAQLKGKEDYCVIVCADVVLFKLVENGITPDFVVTIDPSDSISRFWEDLDTSKYSYVCPTTVSSVALEKWKGNFFFYNQTDVPGSDKQKILAEITKATYGFGQIYNKFFVGATMLQFAQLFTPSSIILMGYDFGFTDGKAYCNGLLDRKLYDLNNVGMNVLKAREIAHELVLRVDDSFVKTRNLLNMYKNILVQLCDTLVRAPVINSTEGGLLTEILRMPLQDSLQEYCSRLIKKHDVGTVLKRPRKRR